MNTVTEYKLPGGQSMRVQIVNEAPITVLKEYGAILAKNAALSLNIESARQKSSLARQAAEIFAKDIDNNSMLTGISIEEAIQAADFSDPSNNVGLLSGSLVLQKALPMMQYEYPLLRGIVTDFADEPGLLNQTEVTRITTKPAVQTYNPTPDSAGRPKGWDTVSQVQTIDVPVTLDEYVGVPIVFGQNVLAATMRKLFSESTPMALYALGGYMVDKLTALFTPANFNAYKGTTAAGGVTTAGSTAITATSTANMYSGQLISGTGIPVSTYIVRVNSSTTATLSREATADGTGLTFAISGGKVPITYPTYAKPLADFNMASLGDIGAALSLNEVPRQDRSIMLNTYYYQRLSQDPSFNTFFAATRHPEIVTESTLPRLQGFNPMEAPFLPTSNNLVGFAFHKAAAILKTRLPNDLSKASGAEIPGRATTITDPNTGLSVLLVQYSDLRSNYAEWRPEVILGAAVGDRRGGLCVTQE